MRKQLTVMQLREALARLPDDCMVEVNAVGNLSVSTAQDDCYLGYVDFRDGRVELLAEAQRDVPDR
jgi:hypothetical protein